ncbi:hypothetical protein [Spirillospora sp. NPDC048819]|uniref:hypothetical protein n=1 Tax=Spirillospora sp. NPDC048819 TaxID=3155268 RepID=UPI0033DBDBCC
MGGRRHRPRSLHPRLHVPGADCRPRHPGRTRPRRRLPRAAPRHLHRPRARGHGLTERQARDQGLRVRTSLAPIASSARGLVHGPGNERFVKLVEDADRGVLVGATSAGPAEARSCTA